MRLCGNTNLTPLSIVAMCPCCNVAILPLSIAKPRALFTVTERVDKRRLLTMSRIFHWSLLCEIFTRYFVEDIYSAWYFCAMAKYISHLPTLKTQLCNKFDFPREIYNFIFLCALHTVQCLCI